MAAVILGIKEAGLQLTSRIAKYVIKLFYPKTNTERDKISKIIIFLELWKLINAAEWTKTHLSKRKYLIWLGQWGQCHFNLGWFYPPPLLSQWSDCSEKLLDF